MEFLVVGAVIAVVVLIALRVFKKKKEEAVKTPPAETETPTPPLSEGE